MSGQLHSLNGHQASSSRSSRYPYSFDPLGTARVERLRLARRWRDEGSIYQALCTYADMMARYRDTPAGDAAAEELLEMASTLERQGMYYTALAVFSKIDQMA